MKYIINAVFFCFLLSACKEKKIIRKRIDGKNIIEAKFINDSVIDGVAKFYDLQGNLKVRGTYLNGKRNGPTLIFYENRKIKDSLNYDSDLLNGKSFKYDSTGLLLFTLSYYYGIEVGDHPFYTRSGTKNYYFTNFEKEILVKCRYDSLGRCDSFYFNAYPIITDFFTDDNVRSFRIFFYFPHPPDFEAKYTIGLINENGIKQNEIILNSNRIFLDTTLSKPQKMWHYFVSIDYKNVSTDSIVNMYYKEVK